MKFSLISDMHIDFPQEKTPYDLLEKKVVVAGDTSNGLSGLTFLQKLKDKGFEVYAVDGNHEHYANASQDRDIVETTTLFRDDHRRYHDEDIPIVLANGWYPVKDETLWYRCMNDGRKSNTSAEEVNRLAKRDYNYIKSYLNVWKNSQRRGVVVTHTAPCEETLNPEYKGHRSNEWYWNPLMYNLLKEFQDQILVWCHGHSHAFMDEVVEGVRVVCNPRGYPGENPSWKPFTIEVN